MLLSEAHVFNVPDHHTLVIVTIVLGVSQANSLSHNLAVRG